MTVIDCHPVVERNFFSVSTCSSSFGGKVVGLPTKGDSSSGMKYYVSLMAFGVVCS